MHGLELFGLRVRICIRVFLLEKRGTFHDGVLVLID
jgi:hypothetical protein